MGNTTVGIVFLVGAGPGDPGLITLRGVECLRQAEVVLYDALANPDLLQFAPDTAVKICLDRHESGAPWSLEEILESLVRHALAGRVCIIRRGYVSLLIS